MLTEQQLKEEAEREYPDIENNDSFATYDKYLQAASKQFARQEAYGNSHGAEQEGVKDILDELHKRKIDLSDEVFVLNVGGYIGESTRNEINYAESVGKPIFYLENNQP